MFSGEEQLSHCLALLHAAGFELWELSVKLPENPFNYSKVRPEWEMLERKVSALRLNENENVEEE